MQSIQVPDSTPPPAYSQLATTEEPQPTSEDTTFQTKPQDHEHTPPTCSLSPVPSPSSSPALSPATSESASSADSSANRDVEAQIQGPDFASLSLTEKICVPVCGVLLILAILVIFIIIVLFANIAVWIATFVSRPFFG